MANPVIDQSQQRIHKGPRGELAVHLRSAVLGEGIRQLSTTTISADFPRPQGGCVRTSSVYNWTLAFRWARRFISATTASFGLQQQQQSFSRCKHAPRGRARAHPFSPPLFTVSHASIMYSQFSDVRFSSVALAVVRSEFYVAEAKWLRTHRRRRRTHLFASGTCFLLGQAVVEGGGRRVEGGGWRG